MRAMVFVTVALLTAVSGTASASFIEDTTGVCWQNDGSEELSADCDFPDSIGALLAAKPNEFNCNTKPAHDKGHTYGTLVPPHDVNGVPQEDTNDFCYAHLLPNLPEGSRVSFTLRVANQDAAVMAVSLHLWDVETGQPIVITVISDEADAASTSSTSGSTGVAVPVHTGISPFHPVSVSEVYVDGIQGNFQEKTTMDISQLDFVVKNDPQVLTVDGTGHALHTGDAVRLCGYSGKISYSLTAIGGNIKLDGSAVGFAIASGLSALPSCTQVILDPVCKDDDADHVYTCTINVSARIPTIALEARAHARPPPALVQARPARCHSLCALVGIEDPFPTDWFIDLDQLTGPVIP